MGLQSLPPELIDWIVEDLVRAIGIYKAVQLKLVSKSFNRAVLYAICTRQAVDIHDPATPYVYTTMNASLKGKILLTKSRTEEVTTNIVLSVIAGVNKALDRLTQATEEKQREQHGMISEAVAHLGSKEVQNLNLEGPQFEEEHLTQSIFSGAIVIGNLTLVKYLLSYRSTRTCADVNKKNPFFGRPLHIAAAWGHADIVEFLLGSGADLRAISGFPKQDWKLQYPNDARRHVFRCPDDTALRAAALGGHNEVIHVLLAPKYQPSFKRQKHAYHRAMVAAARGGHLDTLELLRSAKRSTSELPQGLQQNILYETVDHNREALVRMLLIEGADVNVFYQERRYGFLLAIAAAKGHARIVSLLLEYRADMNVCTRHGNPVSLAALNGHQEAVHILLSYGASYADAFLHAASGCQVHLLRCLLREVINSHILASTQWKIFREAMDAAILYKNPTIISMLVGSGIPIDVPTVSRRIYMAEDHAPWLSDFVISLGVDLRTRLIGRSSGKEWSKPSMRGDILITKRTWEWVGKY